MRYPHTLLLYKRFDAFYVKCLTFRAVCQIQKRILAVLGCILQTK